MVPARTLDVSVARPVLKEATLLLTRRVRGRVFLLRPCKRIDQIVGYVLAVMSVRWNIAVHAVAVLSNHWHVVVTDPDGNIVDFQRDCHSFIARGLNAYHGEFEAVWCSSQGSRVELQEPEDLVAKIAYTMANVVEAGLVRYGANWPGLRMAWPRKPVAFQRPRKFFRGKDQGGGWPKSAVFELARPPGYNHLSDEELGDLLASRIKEREERFRRKFDAESRPFLGRRAVLRQSRYGRPATREPRFGISPQIACRSKWRRIECLQQRKLWRASYREARDQWRAGNRDVVFPAGTYQMRVLHGVRCAEPD